MYLLKQVISLYYFLHFVIFFLHFFLNCFKKNDVTPFLGVDLYIVLQFFPATRLFHIPQIFVYISVVFLSCYLILDRAIQYRPLGPFLTSNIVLSFFPHVLLPMLAGTPRTRQRVDFIFSTQKKGRPSISDII